MTRDGQRITYNNIYTDVEDGAQSVLHDSASFSKLGDFRKELNLSELQLSHP